MSSNEKGRSSDSASNIQHSIGTLKIQILEEFFSGILSPSRHVGFAKNEFIPFYTFLSVLVTVQESLSKKNTIIYSIIPQESLVTVNKKSRTPTWKESYESAAWDIFFKTKPSWNGFP